MGKTKLFDDNYSSEDEVNIKTDNQYAKNYNIWRNKEELNKLKTKYGEDTHELGDDSSSSSEDEEVEEIDEEDEKKFFQTLSCLIAKKDPGTLYDEDDTEQKPEKKRKKKEKPTYIKDYERQLLLEKGGVIEEEDADFPQGGRSPTYVEEQKHLKDSLKGALDAISESEDEDTFKPRQKASSTDMNESDYKEWLAGQKTGLQDKELEAELQPLKEYWNDPNLDEGEKFLRDYILNKRYLDKEDEGHCPTYDELIHDSDKDLSEDERELERQEEFEYKYNFRFEEPDPEFIKTYPRTMANSLRRTDDRRKIKRAETKERKQNEKKQKMEERRRLQELKRLEIEEKIAKLKDVTGKADVRFEDVDFEGDFDPEEHDKNMQMIFNDDFYQGPEGDQKPEFPDLDEELEIENWNNWQGNDVEYDGNEEEYEPNCEDENFNMDCDYDPEAVKKELMENTKGRKKRKRKSKFAEALSKPKPAFDPNDKTYEQYLDEYYKLNCEDVIGDLPCRFKYREVVPNTFGLTIEEILMANDKELNRWCSLKKLIQRRPENVEKYDQIAYGKKGQSIELKKKILPSLFKNEEESEDLETAKNTKQKSKNQRFNVNSDQVEENGDNIINSVKSENNTKEKSKKHSSHNNDNSNKNETIENKVNFNKSKDSSKKKKKNKATNKNSGTEEEKHVEDSEITSSAEIEAQNTAIKANKNKKRQKKKDQGKTNGSVKKLDEHGQEKSNVNKQDISAKQHKINRKRKFNAGNDQQDQPDKKIKKQNYEEQKDVKLEVADAEIEAQNTAINGNKKKKRKKKKNKGEINGGVKKVDLSGQEKYNVNKQDISTKQHKINKKMNRNARNDQQDPPNKKIRKQNNEKRKDVKLEVSDARLASFGYNPKKYKNKIKYSSK